MKEHEQLALVSEIAEKIATLSIETAITIPELIGPNSMIFGLADKKVKEILGTTEARIEHTLKVWSKLS